MPLLEIQQLVLHRGEVRGGQGGCTPDVPANIRLIGGDDGLCSGLGRSINISIPRNGFCPYKF